MGEKSRDGWCIPICLRECSNRDKKCDECFRFSNYKPIEEKEVKYEK